MKYAHRMSANAPRKCTVNEGYARLCKAVIQTAFECLLNPVVDGNTRRDRESSVRFFMLKKYRIYTGLAEIDDDDVQAAFDKFMEPGGRRKCLRAIR